ncbi:MAG: hypothetical protein DHS20C02_17550 [Micavibrio sp.]|nr:MAG: hypothetical protein DHS20C02_17550 [Micavibrio sp.]
MSKKENKNLRRVPPEAKIIGRNLRDLRMERNLSRREVAAILDVSFQQLQKYESGQNRFPLDKLYVMKGYCDVTYERFFEGFGLGHFSNGESLPKRDQEAYAIYMKLIRLKDNALKKKIYRVVSILIA